MKSLQYSAQRFGEPQASFDTHLPARQPETVNENRASDARHKENMLARFALDMARLLGKDVNDLREEFLQLGYEQQFQFVHRMLMREGMLSQSSARDKMINLPKVFLAKLCRYR